MACVRACSLDCLSAYGGGQHAFLLPEVVMTIRSWLRSLFTRPVTRPLRKRPPQARPALEDRTVPSTFTVLNTQDDGSIGSLRWAVGQANAHAGPDTIHF